MFGSSKQCTKSRKERNYARHLSNSWLCHWLYHLPQQPGKVQEAKETPFSGLYRLLQYCMICMWALMVPPIKCSHISLYLTMQQVSSGHFFKQQTAVIWSINKRNQGVAEADACGVFCKFSTVLGVSLCSVYIRIISHIDRRTLSHSAVATAREVDRLHCKLYTVRCWEAGVWTDPVNYPCDAWAAVWLVRHLHPRRTVVSLADSSWKA